MKTDVEKFLDWAHQNYERGADVYIECYTHEELSSFVAECGGLRKAVASAKRIAGIRNERRADAKNSAF